MQTILGGNGIGWAVGRTVKRSPLLLPNQVSGLTGWWDASLLSQTDGTSCSSLPNQQGTSGRDFGASGTNRPTFRSAIKNGLNILRFDGSDDRMAAGGTPATYLTGTAATIVVVCNPTTPTLNSGTPYGNHPILAGATDYFGVYGRNSSPATAIGYTWLSSSRSVSANLPGANNWVVIAFRLVSTTTIKISVNGGTEASATSDGINVASGLSGEFRLGAGGSNYFNGDLAEAATWSVAISDSDCSALIASLKTKWGIS